MPELPEVETILQRLLTVLPGKQVQAVEVLRSKSFIGEPDQLVGATITSIERRSKILIFSFDRAEKLLVHLKMTGQLIYVDATTRLGGGHPTADWIQALPSTHTRVAITLSETAHLFFNDQRVFGWLKVVDQAGVHAEFATLGPDITENSVTPDYFFNGIKKRSVPIKQLIMENSFIAGVGNIYANDALHAAGINPFQPACALKHPDSDRLLEALKKVIQLGIDMGGATIDHFRHIDGFSGNYQTIVRVYGREGCACGVCGDEIKRKKLGGRSTFYCPTCQD